MSFKRICFFVAMMMFVATSAFSATRFVVRHIQVQGLQRVSKATVLAAVPLRVGQTYTSRQGDEIIESVYKTGFFSNVRLDRIDQTLVIKVVERPTIGSIQITGNKSIKSKQLKPVLKKLGIVLGHTFDPSKFHAIVTGLQQQYSLMGHSGAIVTPSVKYLTRNRVAIHIKIQEGDAIIARSIRIVGNHAFSQHRLLSHFKLTTPGLLTWFTHSDRYSKYRLEADLQRLQNFYFDHGYLQFRVISKKVTQLSSGKGIAIVITVSEGPVYRLSGYKLVSKLPHATSLKIHRILSQLKVGTTFSRKELEKIDKKIINYLADHGHAFPQIKPEPTLNQSTHQVFLTYHIKEGQRVYVKDIHILGNTRTSGLAIRSQLRQMEGGAYSLKNVKESKRRINNLGYLNKVSVSTVPVAGTTNQVDLNYHVHEVNAGRASVQAGYSDVNGFLYGASISEPNFMGTGRYIGIGFQRSEYTDSYNLSYNNPFYTVSGISRGFNFYYSHTTPAKVDMDPYTMDDYGASMNFGVPISEFDQLTFGVGFSHVAIGNVNSAMVSPSVVSFLASNPSPFNQFKLTTGFSHVTLNRAIFPTTGSTQSIGLTLGVPVLKSSLSFYQLVYNLRWYIPMGHGFILSPHGTLGYGDGYGDTEELPFFNNFYAGGLRTLPGYEGNSLGPKNPLNTNQALGGNVEALGGLNFILPDFISHKVRTAVFVAAGNIFQTHHTPGISYESVNPKNLRGTAGIMVSWWSPLGAPLDFSLALPLNKKPGDQTELFNFSFGAAL